MKVPEEGIGKRTTDKNDPHRLLVQRILATNDFIRSPQLSKFLLYICNATFEDPGRNLSEQHIGVAVFGREPDYDSAADTIVRSHALRLRRRLEQYFQRAGRQEPIHLLIPKGGYAPVFLPASKRHADSDAEASLGLELDRDGTAAINFSPQEVHSLADAKVASPEQKFPIPPEVPEEPQTLIKEAQRGNSEERASLNRHIAAVVWRYRALTAVLTLLCIGMTVAFGLHMRLHIPLKRHHLLWGRLFTDDQPTQIVLGDSGLVLFHAFARRYLSLQDYLNDDVSKQMPYIEHIEPKFALFLLHRRYTSVVDATALSRLMRLPEAIPERTLVHYSRDMHLNDFKSGNSIMIGAEEAVPWVELFETHMDFSFSIENPDRHASFLNRHPHPGELTEYSSAAPRTSAKAYSVIAFLPNLSATGNVLILEGLSMIGTEAAVDLVCDDDRLIPILDRIRKRDRSLPYFEILLESDTLGDSAGPARVIAVHLHD